MACEICGRGSCTRAFHSLEAQDAFDRFKDVDRDDLIAMVVDMEAEIEHMEELLSDYKLAKSLEREEEMEGELMRMAVLGDQWQPIATLPKVGKPGDEWAAGGVGCQRSDIVLWCDGIYGPAWYFTSGHVLGEGVYTHCHKLLPVQKEGE